MGAGMDQLKMINQLRKAQRELKNEIVEVDAGDGAAAVGSLMMRLTSRPAILPASLVA